MRGNWQEKESWLFPRTNFPLATISRSIEFLKILMHTRHRIRCRVSDSKLERQSPVLAQLMFQGEQIAAGLINRHTRQMNPTGMRR